MEAESAAIRRSKVRIAGLRQSLSTAEMVADRYQALQREGASSELQVVAALAKVTEFRTSLDAEEEELIRPQSRRDADQGGREARLRKEIEANLNRIASLDTEIRKAEVLLSRISVQAPISGLVFDLNVSRGDVVPGGKGVKPMLQIIPEDDLQAKIYIPNEAIGFIRKGQRADISLTAFNASDYGYLPATVQWIGSDALTPKEQQRELGQDAKGLYFPATLKLESQALTVGQRSVPLQPGMSLTADLHLRTRRFISAITDLLDKTPQPSTPAVIDRRDPHPLWRHLPRNVAVNAPGFSSGLGAGGLVATAAPTHWRAIGLYVLIWLIPLLLQQPLITSFALLPLVLVPRWVG